MKMHKRQGTMEVEKNSRIPAVFWRQDQQDLLMDRMGGVRDERGQRSLLRLPSWVTGRREPPSMEMVKARVEQVWGGDQEFVFENFILRGLLDTQEKKHIYCLLTFTVSPMFSRGASPPNTVVEWKTRNVIQILSEISVRWSRFILFIPVCIHTHTHIFA